MEHHGSDRYLNHSSKEFCFGEKEEYFFYLGRTFNHVEGAAQEAGKVGKKNNNMKQLWNWSLTPKYRGKQFPNNFYATVKMPLNKG